MPDLIAIAFRIVRTPLVGGVVTPIRAPLNFTCSSVSIINTTGDDLRIITSEDGTEFAILPNNYERIIWLPQSGPTVASFRANAIGFWLRAEVDGTAILVWS